MTPEQFAYWLQGYAELNDAPPTEDQWNTIRAHLDLVFNKVTPPHWLGQPKVSGPLRWPPINTRATGSDTALASVDGETRLVC